MTIETVAKYSENELGRSYAVFSEDMQYRYYLARDWGANTQHTLWWIMLNPSTADEVKNDPTVRRCQNFAKAWGYDGFAVVNLYALRSANPAALLTHPDPRSYEANADYLDAAIKADHVAAWGVNGGLMARDFAQYLTAKEEARITWCLGVTKEGHPRHPLYVPNSTVLQPWRGYDEHGN